jgi:hypothetical protein
MMTEIQTAVDRTAECRWNIDAGRNSTNFDPEKS